MLDDENWTKSKVFIPLWSGDCRYLMKNRISCNLYEYMRGNRLRVMSLSS